MNIRRMIVSTGAEQLVARFAGHKSKRSGFVVLAFVATLVLLFSSPLTADYVGSLVNRIFLDPVSIPVVVDGFDDGDVVSFILETTPADTGSDNGHAAWMSVYIPPGAEVLGAEFVLPATNGGYDPIPAEDTDVTYDGWGVRGRENYVPTTGATQLGEGYVNEVQQDTGIFYSTDVRTQLVVDGVDENCDGTPDLVNPTGVGTELVYNRFDYDQTQAFGEGFVNGGQGNTPLRGTGCTGDDGEGCTWTGVGSIVAGPDTYYTNDYNPGYDDCSDGAGGAFVAGCDGDGTPGVFLDESACVGPWERIAYANSKFGGSNSPEKCLPENTCPPDPFETDPTLIQPAYEQGEIRLTALPTSAGWDLGVDGALPSGNLPLSANPSSETTYTVRFVHGKRRLGELENARITLRIIDSSLFNASVFIDDGAAEATDDETFCLDSVGGDTSDTAAKDNPFRYYEPQHECAFLGGKGSLLKSAKFVNGEPSNGASLSVGDIISYQISFTNTSGGDLTLIDLYDRAESFQGVPTNNLDLIEPGNPLCVWPGYDGDLPGPVYQAGTAASGEARWNQIPVLAAGGQVNVELCGEVTGGGVNDRLDNTAFVDYNFSGSPADRVTLKSTTGGTITTLISGAVYNDADGSGDLTAGEAGVSGVLVELYDDLDGDGILDPGEPLIDSRLTLSDGSYNFAGLPGGDYIVVETDPAGSTSTGDKDNGLGTCGSGNGCNAIGTTVAAGGASTLNDFFDEVPTASLNRISGTTFIDSDSDAAFEPLDGESGYGGVTVRLYRDNNNDGAVDLGDTLFLTQVTDMDGEYLFSILEQGSFVLEIDETTLPIGAILTTDNVEEADFVGFGNLDEGNDFGFFGGVGSEGGVCYAVADSVDQLVAYDTTGMTFYDIGPTGTVNIEAIALNPFTGVLYATNAAQLGTLNQATGAFTVPPGTPVSQTCNLPGGGPVTVNDIDGLTFDPYTGVLYGTERDGDGAAPEDVLLQLDPATGLVEADAFGSGVSCVRIQTNAAPTNFRVDIDDIAIDPNDGQLYGIANSGGVLDRLVQIDKLTGAVTDLGEIGIGDIEGLGFANDGTLYAVDGAGATAGDLYTLVKSNPTSASFVFNFPSYGDYESVDCMTSAPNAITGTVFFDPDADGVRDPGEVGSEGATVRLYLDDGDGVFNPLLDTLLETTSSDASGFYSFETAGAGTFFIDTDFPATYPPGASLTTDNEERADFAPGGNQTDTGNDFGFILPAGILTIDKSSSAKGLPVAQGGTITYSMRPRADGPVLLSNIVVSDLLPAGTGFVGANPTQDAGPDPVIWNLGSNQPGVPGSDAGFAGTVTLGDESLEIEDTWIDQDKPNDNFGDATELEIKEEAAKDRRALIRWDLSAIPVGATITSVTMSFRIRNDGAFNIDIHPLTASWEEGTGDNNDSADWLRRDDAPVDILWAAPGGDFDPSVATFTPAPNGVYVDVVDPDLVALVQDWADGTRANYGVILIGDGRDAKIGSGERNNEEPMLVISYFSGSTTTTIATDKRLVSDGDPFAVTMTLTSTSDDTVTAGTLNVSSGLGASASCSLVPPATQPLTAGVPLDFVWSCTATAAAVPDSLTFSSDASGSSGVYQTGTSNSLLVSPPLLMTVTVANPLDANQTTVVNTAVATSDQTPPASDITVDAVVKGRIGDRVWLDTDGDGVQDVGEEGIANVEVTLRVDDDAVSGPSAGDSIIATRLTGADGDYLFAGLPPGTYWVDVNDVTLPAGLEQSPGNTDPPTSPETTPLYVVATDQVYLTADFGYTSPAGTGVIGNYLWNDIDRDGVQDPTEIGIDGVTLELRSAGPDGVFGTVDDVVEDSTTTAADGSYLFTAVAAGEYIVVVTDTGGELTGFAPTVGPQSEGASVSAPVTVAAGDVVDDVDFGYAPAACLPRIDFETDALGNPLVAGQVIDDEWAAWGITASFTVNAPSTGPLMIFDSANPTGGDVDLGSPNETCTPPGPGIGTEGELGQPGENCSHQGNILILSEDGDGSDPDDAADGGTIFFSFADEVEIDALSFLDSENNQDSVEALAAPAMKYADRFDVTAFNNSDGLLDWSADPWDEVTTDDGTAGGGSITINVTPGELQLEGSGGNPERRIERDVDLTGFDAATLSFDWRCVGDMEDASQGAGADFVYIEISADGGGGWITLDTKEGDVDICLEPGDNDSGSERYDLAALLDADPSDSRIRFRYTISAADEDFFVDNLEVSPTLFFSNLASPGDNAFERLPIGVSGARELRVTFPASGALAGIDFCLGSLRDKVWLDANEDGLFQPGELGIPGVTVSLLSDPDGIPNNGDEVVVATTITDANGNFGFDGLEDGNYLIQITDTAGELSDLGGTTAPGIARELAVSIVDGEDVLGINFGYNAAGTLGDRIWSDVDPDGAGPLLANGVQDPGEPGIGGVLVNLLDGLGNPVLDAANNPITAITAPDGSYLFSGLSPGDYIVEVDLANFAAGQPLDGYTQTGDPDEAGVCATCDAQGASTLGFGDSDLTLDFGYQATTAAVYPISGTVFEDGDEDGFFDDPGEDIFAGVTIELRDDLGNVIATTTTDASGNYLFADQPDGNYTVAVTDQAGILDGYRLTSGLDAIDVTVAGAPVADIDFGYIRDPETASIGDTVWFDTDGDGLLGPSEPGIPNVAMDLYQDDGDGVLEPTVEVISGGIDLNGDGMLNASDDGVLGGGQPSSPTGRIGIINGLLDLDGDGVIESNGEDDGTFNGAVVINGVIGASDGTLSGDDGTPIATTLTDGNGQYLFPDLVAGDYFVDVNEGTVPDSTPDGVPDLLETGYPAGVDPSAAITLSEGERYEDADFGYVPRPGTAAIGDRVWHDTNGDGFQDDGELGIPGVDIIVSGPSGDVTITTGADGFWMATGLSAASSTLYSVNYDSGTVPAGLTQTFPNGPLDPELSYQVTVNDGDLFTHLDYGFTGGAYGQIGNLVWLDLSGDGIRHQIINGRLDLNEDGFGDDADDGVLSGITIIDGRLDIDGDGVIESNGEDDGTFAGKSVIAGELDFDGDGFITGADDGPSEPPIEDVTVSLIDDRNGDRVWDPAGADGIFGTADDEPVLETATTDAAGFYLFTGVPLSANYLVDVSDIGGVLADLQKTSGAADTDNNSQDEPYDVAMPGVVTAILTGDFGYTPAGGFGSIGNKVWRDLDADGFRDPGEPGIEGVTVELWVDVNGNGSINPGVDNLVRTTTTDVSGEYEFKSLPFEDYLVSVTDDAGVLTNFVKTTGPDPGDDDNSQADPYPVTLDSGTPENVTADFGYQANGTPLTISGTVFEDVDNDGVFDDGAEPEIEDATVFLYHDVNGNGKLDPADKLLDSVQTDNNGDYQFIDLPQDDYLVTVNVDGTPVDDYLQTTQTASGGVQSVTLPDNGDGEIPPTDNSVNNNFGFWNGGTITNPITLAWFKAEDLGSGVRFEWMTATETGNVGFNLYGVGEKGLRQLNDELIPSAVIDSLEPQRYELEAWGAVEESFVLEDIDLLGVRRYHGPFERGQEAGAEPRPERIPWGRIRAERGARQQALRDAGRGVGLRAARRARPGGGPVDPPDRWVPVRLEVSQDGIYRVGYEQLLAAGIDLTGAPSDSLALTNGGEPMAIRVESGHLFGPGAFIEFVGRALDTLYTRDNVYTLRVRRQDALRVGREDLPPPPWATAPASYVERLEVNRDRKYILTAPGEDPWYEKHLLAYGGAATSEFEVEIDAYAGGAADLEVDLWGLSAFPRDPDHHVELEWNDSGFAEEWFDGRVVHRVATELSPGVLVEGTNRLRLSLPGDGGTAWDMVAFDRLWVTYARHFLPRQGRLSFTAGAEALEVESATGDAVIYRLVGDQPVLVGGQEYLGDRVRFRGLAGPRVGTRGAQGAGPRYYFAEASALLVPDIAPAAPAALLHGRARLLVISHADFMDEIQPLVEARRAEGWSVAVVDVEEIYSRESHGVVDPQALRDFIARAHDRHKTEAVLLVGGDTYDYHDNLGLGSISFVPSLYTATDEIVRFAPVDPLYGDVDGDGLPEVAVGRLPVRTPEELASLVTRILEYGDSPFAGTALLSADAYDVAGGYSFTAASDQLAAMLPSDWVLDRAYLDELSLADARERLIGGINAGVGLTSYFGHSGPTAWSFENLFNGADAAALENAGRPTVVAQWGCWNNYHVTPKYNTLGHKLLLSGDRGAAAVLGAATLTQAPSEQKLGRLLFARLGRPGATLGSALLAAKQELAETEPDLIDVILGWTLLGDPTMRIDH